MFRRNAEEEARRAQSEEAYRLRDGRPDFMPTLDPRKHLMDRGRAQVVADKLGEDSDVVRIFHSVDTIINRAVDGDLWVGEGPFGRLRAALAERDERILREARAKFGAEEHTWLGGYTEGSRDARTELIFFLSGLGLGENDLARKEHVLQLVAKLSLWASELDRSDREVVREAKAAKGPNGPRPKPKSRVSRKSA